MHASPPAPKNPHNGTCGQSKFGLLAEQVAKEPKRNFADNVAMRVSHEAIVTAPHTRYTCMSTAFAYKKQIYISEEHHVAIQRFSFHFNVQVIIARRSHWRCHRGYERVCA
jgi:hypothetical protein